MHFDAVVVVVNVVAVLFAEFQSQSQLVNYKNSKNFDANLPLRWSYIMRSIAMNQLQSNDLTENLLSYLPSGWTNNCYHYLFHVEC